MSYSAHRQTARHTERTITEKHVIDASTDQLRTRLKAYVRAEGEHSEHTLQVIDIMNEDLMCFVDIYCTRTI